MDHGSLQVSKSYAFLKPEGAGIVAIVLLLLSLELVLLVSQLLVRKPWLREGPLSASTMFRPYNVKKKGATRPNNSLNRPASGVDSRFVHCPTYSTPQENIR